MRLFTDDGDAVPVTVVDVSNNRVTQVKTQENDGYVALQVTFGSRKASRVTKPEAGHLAKAGVEAGEIIQEFRVTAETVGKVRRRCCCARGGRVCRGPKVDVQGTSIGKGYAGTIKRHNMVRNVRRTVTAVRTTCLARSVWHKTQVACSPASA